MYKKILTLILAAAMAAAPVSSVYGGEAELFTDSAEAFTAGENEGIVAEEAMDDTTGKNLLAEETVSEVIQLNIAHNPTSKTVYRKQGEEIFYAGYLNLPGLGLEVVYSDGHKEVIYPGAARNRVTTRGDEAAFSFDYNGGVEIPPVGTYTMTYTVGNQKVSFDNVTVKEFGDFPSITEKGTKTVNVNANGSVWLKFKTGKTRQRYIINTDFTREGAIYLPSMHPDTKIWVKYSDPTPKLKPNTVYYYTAYNKDNPKLGGKAKITVKVADKVKLSSKYVFVNDTNDIVSLNYTGKAINPRIDVYDNRMNLLKKNRDYTVSISNNVKMGTAKITVKGTGKEYTGTVTREFKIVPATPKAKASLKSGKINLTWNKCKGADHYQIYRASRYGGKYSLIATTKGDTLTYKDSKVSKYKTYYYKIRAYHTNTKGSKVYSSYSSEKKVTVK